LSKRFNKWTVYSHSRSDLVMKRALYCVRLDNWFHCRQLCVQITWVWLPREWWDQGL